MTEILHSAPASPSTFEPVLTGPPQVRVPRRRLAFRKRLFDLAIALPAAILTLPIVLALACASFVLYREVPFFRQPRLGHGGKEFTFWKIRTLPRIAPDTADKYQLKAIELPKFAQFLRSRHLDELPQLWLVVAGKMSLVGPRPEMPTLSASFDPAFVQDRLSAKPGCTGLWQVSVASNQLIGESPEWDRYYVDHATLRLDLWILYRTVVMMAGLRVVRTLAEVPKWTGASSSFDTPHTLETV